MVRRPTVRMSIIPPLSRDPSRDHRERFSSHVFPSPKRSTIVRMNANKKIALAMVGLAAAARLVPHPWNFAPVVALGVYSGARWPKLRAGMGITLAALLVSDAVLGFYAGMWYVYAASLIPVLLGSLVRRRESIPTIVAAGLASNLSFFVITNFMGWAVGALYPHTVAGLSACFTAAIPFYGNQVLGDAFYMVALFGGDALLRRWARPALQTA